MKDDKVSSIITKIIQKTVLGEIEWDVTEPPKYFEDGNEDIIPLLYTTWYKEKNIAVFLRRFKYFTDEDEYHWEEKACFAFLNSSGNKIVWEISDRRPILNDLFATVSEKAAGIDSILDHLLDD